MFTSTIQSYLQTRVKINISISVRTLINAYVVIRIHDISMNDLNSNDNLSINTEKLK